MNVFITSEMLILLYAFTLFRVYNISFNQAHTVHSKLIVFGIERTVGTSNILFSLMCSIAYSSSCYKS